MKDAIQQIGSVAGLASFLGLAVLALLYFLQARHIRDLEERATFIPDDVDLADAGLPAAAAATAGAGKKGKEAKAGAAAPGADAPTEVEAARRVEVARAAAERRQRFQERRGGGFGDRGGFDAGSGGVRSDRRGPEPRAMIMIGLGVAVLLIGVVFGIGKLSSAGDSSTSTDPAATAQGTGAPVEVAVLNGTPVPGLAAKVGEEVRNAGSFKLGAVTNTETPFDVTEVMFDPSDPKAQASAQEIAAALQVAQVTPATGEVKKAADGAPVIVIVGEDRAGT